MAEYFPPDESANEIDLNEIFIGRDDQLFQFRNHLGQWLRLAATNSFSEAKFPPSPNNKIQSFVVLLHGRGGFGKSTLLKNYREIAMEYSIEMQVSELIDWEFTGQERLSLFNPAEGEDIDAYQYFNFMCNHLALALGRIRTDFKEFETAVRAVDEAKKQAQVILKQLQREEGNVWLRAVPGEIVLALIQSIPILKNAPMLKEDTITKVISNVVNEGTSIGVEQVRQVWTKLHEGLGNRFIDYADANWQLAKSLGNDLAQFARKSPILIFFDTYEEIDEGDKLLQLIMAASGIQVGWVIAGRDNLWAGVGQRRRSLNLVYGYRDLTLSDRRMVINFSADGVGDFTSSDIQEYFMHLHKKTQKLSLPAINDKDAAHIRNITGGVPLAVKIAAGLYLENFNLISIIKSPDTKREIVEQMVDRYLIHTRTNPDDRARLYGLAILRRPEERSAVAAALDIHDNYESELSRLHRRYGFIFTKQEQPALHQEVRHFLRLWLLDHRTSRSDIIPVVQRIGEALLRSFQELEEQRHYGSLRQRFEDEKWTGLYLDLTEQQFWQDPTEGIKYILPFMFGASIFSREINREARAIGEFFKGKLSRIHNKYWNWVNDSLVYVSSQNPLPDEFSGLKELVRLTKEIKVSFLSPIPPFQEELEAALWWRLGEAYQGKHPKDANYWYKIALERLPDEIDLREALSEAIWDEDHVMIKDSEESAFTRKMESNFSEGETGAGNEETIGVTVITPVFTISDFNNMIEHDPKSVNTYVLRGEAYLLQNEYRRAIEDFDRALDLEPGNVAIQAKRTDASLQLASSLQRIVPPHSSPLNNFGISRRKVLLIGLGGLELVAGGIISSNFFMKYLYKPTTISLSNLPYVYRKHSDKVVGVAWSPDGKRIASASYDHTVQVWDAENGKNVLIYYGHTNRVTCVAWSPDGKNIASGGDDHMVQVWDAVSGELVSIYVGHTDDVHSVDWSHDSKRIASASNDQTVQIWQAQDGRPILVHPESTWVWSAAWSPDDKRIVSGDSDSYARIWNAQNGKLLLIDGSQRSSINSVVWSPDGNRIASGSDDNSVQVWDSQKRTLYVEYLGHSDKVWSVAWSPDGKYLASGSLDYTVQVCDALSGRRLLTFKGHSNGIGALAWSPDSKRIASGSYDHTVQVWNAL